MRLAAVRDDDNEVFGDSEIDDNEVVGSSEEMR